MYRIEFDRKWITFFQKLDFSTQERIVKKIKNILHQPKKRHLKGRASFYVAEVGQYRIIYRVFDKDYIVRFYFCGRHKDYERWFLHFF